MLKVIILGSGTCVPIKKRGAPGIAINSHGHWILIDSGSGTLKRMAIAGIDYKSINYILYTHKHPDHTADLVPFLFALNYTPDYNRKNKLEIIGPTGFKSFIEELQRPYPWISPKGYSVSIREVSDTIFSLGDIHLRSVSVEHGKSPSVAYKLTNGSESIVFSGDTSFCDGIVQISKDSDLLILEASVPTIKHHFGNHLTAEQAGKVAQMAGAKNLALVHFYPICDDYDMRSLCSKEYSGNIVISEDLMELVVSEGNLEWKILERDF